MSQADDQSAGVRRRRVRREDPALMLPVGATVDPELEARLVALGEQLPGSLGEIHAELSQVEAYAEFDAALLLVRDLVFRHLEMLTLEPPPPLFGLLRDYFSPPDCARIARRLLKHPATPIRRRARNLLRHKQPDDVALPLREGGTWTWEGWTRGSEPGRLARHARGRRRQKAMDVPRLADVASLRALLDIRSRGQLGWLLTATSGEGRPYHSFEIPKRDGRPRHIAAPGPQLRAVQRKILDRILSRVPVHDAAHGFVKARSTVTNAAVHTGREILVKFDLENFFPTIHYWRAVGLFAHLGYDVGSGGFSADDGSRAVAPVLARLCCWVEDPRQFGRGHTPQGAPTSPTISNLVCRGMDGRLAGLAARVGARYSRYADDLTFSFDAEPEQGLGRFRWWVESICQQEGFTVNTHKFRVVRRSQRQMVTGIVVNDVLRVPREARRRFRAILHNCRQHGLDSQRGERSRHEFVDYLRGFASYLHMVHPEEGRARLDEVEALVRSEEAGA